MWFVGARVRSQKKKKKKKKKKNPKLETGR